jgi:ankyrin repeat protein
VWYFGPSHIAAACIVFFLEIGATQAQIPPSTSELAGYKGLLEAAAKGDILGIAVPLATGADPNVRDREGRTPLHVAAYQKQYGIMRALLAAHADPNALENQRYDILTIAAVADDIEMLKIALQGGCSAKNITSPYRGTALIAAAHLGHAEIVQELIKAGAPLDHVNNLGWTALIEAVMLGDGGKSHQDTVKALVSAGAKLDIADRNGQTPLMLAKNKKYNEIAAILEAAGAK